MSGKVYARRALVGLSFADRGGLKMKKSGFTLIELLAALLASSVVVCVALNFYNMNLNTCRKIQASYGQNMSQMLVKLRNYPAYGVRNIVNTRRAYRLVRPN